MPDSPERSSNDANSAGRASPSSPGPSRIVLSIYVLVTVAFVGSTTYQVARAVFADNGGAASRARVGTACGDGLTDLEKAIDRAVAASTVGQPDQKEAARRYSTEKQTAWQRYPDVARVCEADPQGPDALAALLRYDRAAEGSALRHAEGLGRVRREVDSFIR